MKFTLVSWALLALASSTSAQSNLVPEPLTKEWLRTSAGNSSLFTRWRPDSHFIAPAGWMNDACGALHDPTTDTYHLHYQFRPNHVSWGNISWGHAISKDLFHWTDIRDWVNDSSVSIASHKYTSAPLAVFTGTTQPVSLGGDDDGTLLTFLTGIEALPTNWKRPYLQGTEVQTMFQSKDAGRTWMEVGIVIQDPPEGWNVTGWRDPNFHAMPSLDALRGSKEENYYAVLGSGLKGPNVPAVFPDAARPGFLGPRMPLYKAPASNLTDWTFLGALWEPAPNSSLGHPDVTGSYGYNFEVSSFFELPIEGSTDKAWFITTGSEGGNTTGHLREQWSLWNRGSVSARANGSIELTPSSGGALDWGMTYAQAVWTDTRETHNDRRLVWGWVNEDIEDDWMFYVARAMGYAGAMALPVEVFVKETRGVQKHDYVDGNEWVPAEDGGFKAQTLGIKPPVDVMQRLKRGSTSKTLEVGTVAAGLPKRAAESLGNSFVLEATLASPNGTAGMVVAQSPDNSEYTTIVLDTVAKRVSVRREHSSSLAGVFRNYTLEGYFAPYVQAADGKAEDVKFTVVYDKSLLEVFVNDRFVLTTRIYPIRGDSTGLSFFAGEPKFAKCGIPANRPASQAGAATWKDVTAWTGLANAWPKRPENSSSPLVFDGPELTNNYTWYSGW